MRAVEHQKSQQAAAGYLEYFGFASDPFEATRWPFFNSTSRDELLDQLVQYCESKRGAVAVVGESGVGKSCLRLALGERLEGKAKLCTVEVPLLSNAEWVLFQLAQQFGVRSNGSSASARIQAIQNVGRQSAPDSVIVIDDAHNLDDDSLDMILALAGADHGSTCLVLFAEPELIGRLARLDKKHTEPRIMALKALTEEELADYLRFRLDTAGFDGAFPFGADELYALWEVSQGVPAAVHDRAREVLANISIPPPQPRSLGLPKGHVGVLVALVVGLMIALFYRSAEQAQQPVGTTAGNAAGDNATPDDGVGGAAVSAIQAPERTLERSPTEATMSPREPTNDSSAEHAPPGPGFSADNQVAGSEIESGGLVDMSASSPPATTPARESASGISSEEEALLARLPEHFTLQVLASSSREAVDDFVRRQPNRNELTVFTARREGKLMHIAVYGDFVTVEAARSAVASLPEEQQRSGPWPRSLATVQADIRQLRGL
ncbi:MAG: AAA family ATPase [Cellvibrionaceae bacterium]